MAVNWANLLFGGAHYRQARPIYPPSPARAKTEKFVARGKRHSVEIVAADTKGRVA